jgi:hypothetical protein
MWVICQFHCGASPFSAVGLLFQKLSVGYVHVGHFLSLSHSVYLYGCSVLVAICIHCDWIYCVSLRLWMMISHLVCIAGHNVN